MRILKFRIWSKTLKNFEDSASNWANDSEELYCPIRHIFIESLKIIQESDDYIIQQFTGLKDKNGKEIYEGDILSAGSTYKPYVVEYNDRIGAFAGGMFRFNGEGMSIRTVSLEIIGNILENPELL